MELVLGSLTLAAVATITSWVVGGQRRAASLEAWAELAASLGLAHDSDQKWLFMSGTLDGLAITIRYKTGASLQSRCTEVSLTGDFPENLVITHVGTGQLPTNGFPKRRFLSGDERLDSNVRIGGSSLTARALLNRETRAGLLDSSTAGMRLESQTLRWSQVGPPDPEHFPARLHALIALANRLIVREPLTVMLTCNVGADPLPVLKYLNLEALMEHNPDAPGLHAVARACLTSTYPPLALQAALALGDEGLPYIERLLEADILTHALRAKAFKALGARGEEGLLLLLKDISLEVRMLAVRGLGVCGTLTAVEPLRAYQHGLIFPEERAAARRSISAIQARHGGERGTIALIGGEAGELSLIDASGAVGDVSLVKED